MKKLQENKIFESVYGRSSDWKVVPSESPDFVCFMDGQPFLGVEVTKLYRDESHARLKEIDGYALNLIEGGNYRHKTDKKRIRVEKIQYQSADGSEPRNIRGIFDEGISYKDAVAILMEQIMDKTNKVHIYLSKCQFIDLIIHDASSMFSFEDYKIISRQLSAYLDKRVLFSSKFREIYLLTLKRDKTPVKIPIKLNLFAEDVFIFEKLIRNDKLLIEQGQVFELLFCCLKECGYGDLEVVTDSGELSIIVGSHRYAYTKKGKIISECSTEMQFPGKIETITDCSKNVNDKTVRQAQALLLKRNSMSCYLDLFAPCETL